jgi:hypothetical protein
VVEWECPFSKEQLLELWAAPNQNALPSDNHKRAKGLLEKYSGSYEVRIYLGRQGGGAYMPCVWGAPRCVCISAVSLDWINT